MQPIKSLRRTHLFIHKPRRAIGAHPRSRFLATSTTTIATKPELKESSPPLANHEETDLLIIGSGAGALTANLKARSLGLRTILIEKEGHIGGSSAISGGDLWIPVNPLAARHGIKDTKEAALSYFEAAVGDVGPCSSLAKREAFVHNGPRMVDFLESHGMKFHFTRGYPDYYPSLTGAMAEGGRTIETEAFDIRKLGEWKEKLPPPLSPLPIHTEDARVIARMTSSMGAFAYSMRRLLPMLAGRLVGRRLSTMGHGLVAQLLYLNLNLNVKSQQGCDLDIRLNTSLTSLRQSPDGRITGAELTTPQGTTTIHAKATLLSAGGFARNPQMRIAHLPHPTNADWSNSPLSDTGDAITQGIRVGSATALLDEAWWGPTTVDPVSGKNKFALFERSLPHGIIVDSTGKRFMNEAGPYNEAGLEIYERQRQTGWKVKAVPSWLVIDSRHRGRYMLGGLLAGVKPSKEMLEKKVIYKADTLPALAEQIGVDAEGLLKTTSSYNEMCISGLDTDFRRGQSAYDRFFGDSSSTYYPNPNMGAISKPPFYAIAIWPGDLGTKGGLLTDEKQRVLGLSGKNIPGLYAIGNTAASIMGRKYLGAGATLGPAMVGGFVVGGYLGGGEAWG